MKKLVIFLLSVFLCHTVVAQTDIDKARKDSIEKRAISLKTISFKFPAFKERILAEPGDEEGNKVDISIGHYEAKFDFNSDSQIIVTFNKYKDNKLEETISKFEFPLDKSYMDVRGLDNHNFSLAKLNSYSIYIRNANHEEGYCILRDGGMVSNEFSQKISEDVIKRNNIDSTAYESPSSFNEKYRDLALKINSVVKYFKQDKK